MPLPQNAVDQIAREPAWTPGWSGRLLMFSFTILFVSIMVFLGLKFGYSPYLKAKVNDVDAKTAAFLNEYPLATRASIIRVASQFSNLSKILSTYTSSQSVLGWLETHTLPSVSFTKLNVDVLTRSLVLTGETKDNAAIAAQLEVFKKDTTMVERVLFKDAQSASRGGWQFSVVVTMKPLPSPK